MGRVGHWRWGRWVLLVRKFCCFLQSCLAFSKGGLGLGIPWWILHAVNTLLRVFSTLVPPPQDYHFYLDISNHHLFSSSENFRLIICYSGQTSQIYLLAKFAFTRKCIFLLRKETEIFPHLFFRVLLEKLRFFRGQIHISFFVFLALISLFSRVFLFYWGQSQLLFRSLVQIQTSVVFMSVIFRFWTDFLFYRYWFYL